MSAREEILERVRRALGGDAVAAQATAAPTGSHETGSHETGYRTTSELDLDARIEMLVDRLEDYRARVEVIDATGLPEALDARLAGGSVVVPAGLPDAWLPDGWLTDSAPVRAQRDSIEAPLTIEQLDAADCVFTSSAVSIAETGTIVLDGSADQGRRAISLVPDHHIVVVPAESIVTLVPEGFGRLDLTRPITMISGPSATSDIELERVEGVHGPRTLDVLIVR